jgi:hypothetical protein
MNLLEMSLQATNDDSSKAATNTEADSGISRTSNGLDSSDHCIYEFNHSRLLTPHLMIRLLNIWNSSFRFSQILWTKLAAYRIYVQWHRITSILFWKTTISQSQQPRRRAIFRRIQSASEFKNLPVHIQAASPPPTICHNENRTGRIWWNYWTCQDGTSFHSGKHREVEITRHQMHCSLTEYRYILVMAPRCSWSCLDQEVKATQEARRGVAQAPTVIIELAWYGD